ncbi:hypothetical protein dsx2_2652 [Desulfovibrio sp. X2]|uniref:hypothetical protein n=1 Tax=Desulfovibrio sp. X2 TaxID=941449 RepID=UPI00035896AE|nr:hypothetical protein [Desulfovibrio sp. X2]EPR42735.1 hypothetical protein dsx2_2652 [Desulfovibrio sp. X2]
MTCAFFSPVINYGGEEGSETPPNYWPKAMYFLDGLNINCTTRSWVVVDNVPVSCEVVCDIDEATKARVLAIDGVYEVDL